ncbi:MAG: energy-coupling factor ABC transporter ATP-binding protein [Pseudomonadales bacterium]
MSALLEIKHLSYRYPQAEQGLENINLQLQAGQRLALMGQNGAGKTTLLQLLVGLLTPQQGEILLEGKVYREERDFVALRRQVGLVFQDPDDQLFCPSVLEDMMFGPLNLGDSRDEAQRKAQQMLTKLGLSHLSSRMASQLSGGEKRLVTLGCVLVMQPKLLLLDEPTNALDRTARERLITLLKALPQAMLVISHDDDFLQQLGVERLALHRGHRGVTTPNVTP